MSAINAEPSMTPESRYEAERGKPIPSLRHSIAQSRLGFELMESKQHLVVSELTLGINGEHFTPDLCVYPKRPINWQKDILVETTMPLVTIELMSATQGTYTFMEHVQTYLAAGVQSAWIVALPFRAVYIFAKDRPMQSFTQGHVVDTVTGLRADLDNVFC